MSSSHTDHDAVADVATGLDVEGKRAALNPFDGGPATLLDATNELCRGYMNQERDGYHQLGGHHAEWLRLLDDEKKLVLNCHRDGLKTTTVLAYLILRLEYDDGYRAIWAMNNQGIAVEKAHTEFNRMVSRNPWLRNLNGVRSRNTVKKKEFANGSSLRVTWLDGGIDGDRAHLLVMDDLIKARGDGDLDAVTEWVEGTAVPMVKDGGRQILVGTRKGRDDLYAHYRAFDAYSTAEYPAILDTWQDQVTDDPSHPRHPPLDAYTDVADPWRDGKTVKMLWPDARGADWLTRKRSEMADYRFWREYCLVFVGGEGNLISPEDVNRPVSDHGCSIYDSRPPFDYTAEEGEAVVVAHDPAQSPTGDDAAFVAFRVNRDGTRTLLDSYAEAGMKPTEIKEQLAQFDDRFDPAMVVIESNGMQQYVAHDALDFNASLRAKVTGIPTTGAKHSWDNGIPRMRGLVESGGIHFYRDHAATEEFIEAIESLTLEDGKIEGHTPDLAAAWYMAEQGIRKLEAMGALDEEDDEDEEADSGLSFV